MNELCGCCEGIEQLTPIAIANRPGLDALIYRVGMHASFLETMRACLSASEYPELSGLTIRTANDLSIALLDAWATVADVLTFYQERIANEGYLRTATERQSILELARAIGYELNPGVAANALLSFVVEDAVGAPGQATLDAGLRVLSIPGQNERPQTFETVEKVTVRAEWNAFRPRMTEPQTVDVGATELFLSGIANVLEPGDGLLLLDAARRDNWDFRIVRTVALVPPAGYTRVTWTSPLGRPE